MDQYGSPDVLNWRATDISPLRTGEVRLRTLAAAVNHTDLRIRAGDWPIRQSQPFPYTPGVEAVGVIVETGAGVTDVRSGQTVITMMQGLGGVRAARPGGYAELVTVDADAVAVLPDGVDPLAMAALGLGGVTAHEGLRRLGALENRRVLVSGAAGGVGSAAVVLARAQRAEVTALIARAAQADYVRRLGADGVVVTDRNVRPTLPSGFDGVLDTVGGLGFGACVEALRAGGVLCLVGAVGGDEVSFDAWSLIRPVVLTGYSTEMLDGPSLRAAISTLADLFLSGRIASPHYEVMPLHDAAKAHRVLEAGGFSGRLLLVP